MSTNELGNRLFEGRTSEIFAWGEDRVLKLYVDGFERSADMEALCLKTVAAGGIRTPRFYEVVEVQNRKGLILERLHGPTLMSIALEDPSSHIDLGRQLADLQASLFKKFSSGALRNRIQCLHQDLTNAPLPRAIKGRLIERLKKLDTGERLLCHYDFHLGNVLFCDQLVIIDWLDASLGPPICDFTRTLLLHGYPDHAGTRMGTLVQAMLERIVLHLGVTESDLLAWLPISAGARLNEGFKGHEADRLLALADRVT